MIPLFTFKESIRFLPLYDIHYGSPSFEAKAFEQTIDYIKKASINSNPVYFAIDGDAVENIVRECVAGAYDQTMTPTQQIEGLIRYLSPVKNKLLYIIPGNHANRTNKVAYYDLMLNLAERLSTKEHKILYYDGGYIRFQVGKVLYIIATTHGDSAAKNWELEVDRLRNNYPKAHLYVIGHNHVLDAHYKPYVDIDNMGCEIEKYVVFMRPGQFIGYPKYAKQKVYQRQIVGNQNIRFDGEKFQITHYPMMYCNGERIPING